MASTVLNLIPTSYKESLEVSVFTFCKKILVCLTQQHSALNTWAGCMLQLARCIHVLILARGVLQAWLSVLLFLWINDLTNVLRLLAQSSALSVPVTVVLILFSPAPPVAMDLHANALPPVLAVPPCPAQPSERTWKNWPSLWHDS